MYLYWNVEIKSAKGSKRDNEIKKAEAEFSQYIDKLPHIGSLHFKCEFHGKSEADKLNNHLFLEDFCYTQIIYVKEGIYTVEGMRIINLDEARQEVDGLFSLYSKFYCDNVWYRTLM